MCLHYPQSKKNFAFCYRHLCIIDWHTAYQFMTIPNDKKFLGNFFWRGWVFGTSNIKYFNVGSWASDSYEETKGWIWCYFWLDCFVLNLWYLLPNLWKVAVDSSILAIICRYQTQSIGRDGQYHHFEKPWFSNFIMFLGMSFLFFKFEVDTNGFLEDRLMPAQTIARSRKIRSLPTRSCISLYSSTYW